MMSYCKQELYEITIIRETWKKVSLVSTVPADGLVPWEQAQSWPTLVLVCLTHWGRVTHICVSKLNIIGSGNGLSPGWSQAIIWTNAGVLLIWPLGTNFSEMLIEIHTFTFKKMHVKMLSAKRRPFCLSLNVIRDQHLKDLSSLHIIRTVMHQYFMSTDLTL